MSIIFRTSCEIPLANTRTASTASTSRHTRPSRCCSRSSPWLWRRRWASGRSSGTNRVFCRRFCCCRSSALGREGLPTYLYDINVPRHLVLHFNDGVFLFSPPPLSLHHHHTFCFFFLLPLGVMKWVCVSFRLFFCFCFVFPN